MRAGIVPWLWGWLLLGCMPALGASSLYVLAPATPGCTRPDALPRARHLAMGQDHALAVLHCQRAGGRGHGSGWASMVTRCCCVTCPRSGEAALYFPASAATPAGKTGRPTGLLWLVMVAGGAMVLWPLLRHGWRGGAGAGPGWYARGWSGSMPRPCASGAGNWCSRTVTGWNRPAGGGVR
ncbi:hypothetical protein RAA17_00930 [Komagataeibacter rhaeticus]|nr:hypothetical protein [Komagataeibacter rhaeticus]